MDQHHGTSMLDGSDLVARLDAVRERLGEHASREAPRGLTDPDPGADERWEAAQVWAHMAEFVGYWHEQLQAVIGEYDGAPVPFGRVKTDPARIAAIEVGRREPVRQLHQRVESEVDRLLRYLSGLTSAEWNARGRHQTRGDMDAEAIVDEFVVGHLEEHADQLDRLARSGDGEAAT